ncbi:DUF3857 domain-containing protein [Sabulilitoribacter multivorans]|uniref:DUF3857 domain-containing protein n=1 Tax=Flaviramulus multivorans TaxID=1304750 RepID=A0ABS9IHC7_9FLAO|nr:DUF3857 domain-containing protein [Flaviramulus multivorans]MCF7559820.1 DUF3857 domain-containing protein [Flaviramulus multivorans]
MNLSFFRRKANKYFALLVVLLLSNSLLANDSIPDNKFLENCKKSDAYLVYYYTDVTYSKFWSGYKRHTSISAKLVVNNAAGVDKFAFLNLTESISNNLKGIKVKTIKSDGSIIELDSSLVFKRESKSNKFGPISYPIPGVEPRDTIETSYAYSEYIKKYELKDFVNLYSNLPSLNSEYTVRTNSELKVRYKTYNNFPDPQVISNDTLIYCVFKMDKVKGVSENQNTCTPCELPYLYYSIEDNKSELVTWKDIYNEEFNVVTQPISLDYEKSSYYRRWKKRVIGEAKDSTKFYQLRLLHKDIQDNFQMEPLRLDELIKSSGYFLKEKRFNPSSIRRLYRQLLEDLEIEYSAVFARSKRNGPIDPHYIRKGEYDHIFYAYNNDKGILNLLYPNDEYHKYQINEIPTSIYNTNAIIAKPYLTDKLKKNDKFITYDFKLAEVDSVTADIIKLPKMNVNNNYLRHIYYSDINLSEKNIFFKYRFSVAGGLSTDLRSFFSYLNQNKEASDFYDALTEFEGNDSAIQIDTVTTVKLKETSPFNFSVVAEVTLKDGVTYLNNDILSISLENLIEHKQVETDLDSVDLNYYLDYAYADYFMIILNFPCEIEVLDIENNQTSFKNDSGEYLFEVKTEGNNTQLVIQSNYKIIKEMIPKEEYEQLKTLNKIVKEIKNKRLIIKLINK